MLIKPKTLVTLNILYFRPDYPSLLNEFLIQMDDLIPELIRVHSFLEHWRKNIEAKINEVTVCVSGSREWRKVDWMNDSHN